MSSESQISIIKFKTQVQILQQLRTTLSRLKLVAPQHGASNTDHSGVIVVSCIHTFAGGRSFDCKAVVVLKLRSPHMNSGAFLTRA